MIPFLIAEHFQISPADVREWPVADVEEAFAWVNARNQVEAEEGERRARDAEETKGNPLLAAARQFRREEERRG